MSTRTPEAMPLLSELTGFRRSWARSCLEAIVAKVRHIGSSTDPFLRNVGIDLRTFVGDPSPLNAEMLARGLRIAARSQHFAANIEERLADEIDLHVLDELTEARLSAQRKAGAA